MSSPVSTPSSPLPPALLRSRVLSWLTVALLVYLLLVGVGAIGDGFKDLTGGNARELFAFATNPLVALMVGMLATALTQSSSTVTSIIVGMVAGGLPLTIAIPMVMGANIGTSLTSTLVSLGHVRNGPEFRRAFAAGTVHDSFNILAVFLLLPIELLFRPLERLALASATFLRGDASLSMADANFMKALLGPAGSALSSTVAWLPGLWAGIALIVLGTGFILFSVMALGKVLRVLMEGRAKEMLHTAIGRGPIAGMACGGLVTIAVQSSSTTTALIVPLAGSGVIKLAQVYPFTIGANIGTTITALMAATAISGPTAVVAMQIALVHLYFNLLGILLIFGLPVLRNIPPRVADWLAVLAERNKLYVLSYILGVFFVAPALVLGSTRLLFPGVI
ncbi:MAG: Na/Pi cotransporter family protein [Deltaproteobacteria bacterium]|nr:MAG: Na/Pi cotransporter family protein [Deltaproteobacteria bacterium]